VSRPRGRRAGGVGERRDSSGPHRDRRQPHTRSRLSVNGWEPWLWGPRPGAVVPLWYLLLRPMSPGRPRVGTRGTPRDAFDAGCCPAGAERSGRQAYSLHYSCVVARDESGPRHVPRDDAGALRSGVSAFSEASTTASDTVGPKNRCSRTAPRVARAGPRVGSAASGRRRSFALAGGQI
jgi:hypothetical protein